MIFRKCKIISKTGNKEMLKQDNGFFCEDVAVGFGGSGEVYITAADTPIGYICLEAEFAGIDDMLVLGDAWERGYGDLGWKKSDFGRLMPWYCAAYDGANTYCFGVKTNPDAFCSWRCGNGKTELRIDIRNGSEDIILNGRQLKACTVVSKKYETDSFSALCDFCGLMCDNPRRVERPIFGGNDWYCNYGDNSREKILEMTKKIAECSPEKSEYKPYMVIDDGWEMYYCRGGADGSEYNGGPWKMPNGNFGDMQSMAEEIEKLGAIPGIWIRPLLTLEEVPQNCILERKSNGIILDPSSDEALNIIKEDMQRLRKWGYKLIKHDFSSFDIFGKWGFEMNMEDDNIHFRDKTKTTAEIIKKFYRAIREGAGEDTLIMGCNTFSHLSAGIFDIQRTGDDTSGVDWERIKKYGVNTLAFRMAQHGTFYRADADCVGITKQIPWQKNREWLDVLAKSGTPLFVSIADDAYTEEVKKDISKAFETAAKVSGESHPVDWQTSQTPEKWESDFGTDCYKW